MNAPEKESILSLNVSLGGVSLTQKALFAMHLSVMIKSGVAIVEALQIIEDSAEGKLKKVMAGVLKSVQSGHPLSDSFARYPKVFSGLFISAISAGEQSGTLEENLNNIAVQLEKEKELADKIKGAMLYPVVILVASFLLGIAMTFLVLPKITPLFEGLKVDLPFTTRALIWFSDIVQLHGVVLFVGLVAAVTFFVWLIRRRFTRPVTHWVLLKAPVVRKITRNANLARFCRTLGMLLKSGLVVDESLRITKDSMGNYYYQQAIETISNRIGKGTKLSDNLLQYEQLFPLMVSRMVLVGEESGKLEETLTYLAGFYEAEVENSTKSLATVMEPALLIVVGLVVGFLALSIITPIYDITGSIRR